MEYLNNELKFAKMRRKSKIKYNLLIKNSQEEFPNFLSTKHFYKKRNTQMIIPSNQNISNINQEDKIELKLSSPKKNNHKHNSVKLMDKQKLIASNNNSLGIDSDNENQNNKQLNPLTLIDKMKLKSILKNFENNILTTHSLYNLEKKCPLNSVTESNYLFFFHDYKDKKRQNKKELKINNIEKMSKSSLISMNMMKKFNDRTNKILETDKTEGTKYSSNINEFRKQIINSYKDSVILKDINKRKINYDNAMKLLESAKEKRIRKAFELEKEFYKNKNNDDRAYLFNVNHIIPEITKIKKRKSKKLPTTTIIKKLNENNRFFSPDIKSKKSFNNLTMTKLKTISNINTKINSINSNNISNLFNKTEINNTSNMLKTKISKSEQNSNKKKLSNNSIKKENKTNHNSNTNCMNLYNNNIYMNYLNNIHANIRKTSKYKSINKSERELIESKEEYKKFTKKVIKLKSKQFADSFASINNYEEYQPLINMNSDMPHLNINSINLKRVIKVNNILKNLYILDDDDLLVRNIQKLKDEVRDIEMKYYTVDGNKKNYHLSFLKNEVKRQTIAKLNHMKNPHFGVPC